MFQEKTYKLLPVSRTSKRKHFKLLKYYFNLCLGLQALVRKLRLYLCFFYNKAKLIKKIKLNNNKLNLDSLNLD